MRKGIFRVIMNKSEEHNTKSGSTSLSSSGRSQEKRIGLLVPSRARERQRRLIQSAAFWLFRGAAAINGIVLIIILYFLVARGWRAINWTFLTQPPL